MNFIRDIFESLGKHFEKGGKYERLYPVFEATETFFLMPSDTAGTAPHIRDNIDVKRFMTFVILALLPPFFFGMYNTGVMALKASGLPVSFGASLFEGLRIVMPIVIVSYAVGLFWEGVFAVVRKHALSEGFFVSGLLFPMTLPPTVPLWQVAVGISFGVVIGKEIFGGTGRNFLNPALTARAFLYFAYPAQLSGDKVWTALAGGAEQFVDGFSGATALAVAALVNPGEAIKPALDDAGFSFWSLFWGTVPGSIGEHSAFLCIIGGIVLVVVGIASYRIMLGGVAGALVVGFLLNLFAGENASPWMGLNPFYHLVLGGFMLGIVYMATDPVSAPGMTKAKWVYGFLIGGLTVTIRVFNPAFPEGIMLAILFMNLFAPLLDYIEIKAKLKNRVQNV